MYADWASLEAEIQCDTANESVLHKFPAQVGKEVAATVVRHIAKGLSIASDNSEPSKLKSDKEVKWTMEVLCFGLSLPLSEMETIKECVSVYCDWMTACLATPKSCVPQPIRDDPNPYIQDMIHHLLNLFVPRKGSGVDYVRRQAVLCHRVMRTIETIAMESPALLRETWEVLLKFLLAANDSLLSPPSEKDDIGDHLCERVLSVLFTIWLLACHKCFPSPSLWKTFRNMCVNWRHHEALITQWHKVNHALTYHLLKFMNGPDFPELHLIDEEAQLIPMGMTDDCIAQCWFRFLHMIQNPVDLCHPEIIGKTPKFMLNFMPTDSTPDSTQHECLLKLPLIFLKAMKGLSVMVNAFLGSPQNHKCEDHAALLQSQGSNRPASVPSTPPGQRKGPRPMSVFTGPLSSKGAGKSNSTVTTPKSAVPPVVNLGSHMFYEARTSLAPSRPRCNSVLHLFGAWLYDAALARVKLQNCHRDMPEKSPSNRRSSSFTDARQSSVSLDYHMDQVPAVDNTYEAGRAEALGTLCRIFSAHKTGEAILPKYYARFYIAMYYGLQIGDDRISGQVLSSILFNSCDILRVDLDGVQILLPHILDALQLVLCDLPVKAAKSVDTNYVIDFKNVELQRACISILLSTLCLPLHFKDLKIRDIVSSSKSEVQLITFMSLKKKIVQLIYQALKISTDATNTQMLLGGLMLEIQDMAMCEAAEQVTLQPHDSSNDSENNQVFAEASQTSVASSSSELSAKEPPYHRLHHPSQDIDSAYGLFGEAVALVCHRLMSTWKTDLTTALAAMEILAGLAKVVVNPPNLLMCKRTVKWICEFIVFQCSRPAPSHSKDLHSMIVAAFKCLTLWLVEHSRLLYDKECLHNVLEVVELGISGSKSQNRASDPPKFKGDKEQKPASTRVKDAAEALLTCIIQHVGAFPPPCGPESLFSLLDEKSLLKYSKGSGLPEQGSPFRYYVLENSIIVGLLEQPLGNVEDLLPTVTALIRGPFGRHAWTMQLRHTPRSKKKNSSSHLLDPGRPLPMENVGTHHNIKHRYFPESVDKIPLTNADKSIPTLESLVTDNQRTELNKLKGFIEKQMSMETNVEQRSKQEIQTMKFPNPDTECKQPRVTQEFQTARMFLSHYGFLSLEALKAINSTSLPPALVTLDTTNSGLFTDLEILDSVTPRDSDTVHVFYVKSGQRTCVDILANVASRTSVQSQFLEFLHSLGWPVDIKRHAGWTGHISTSWKITEQEEYSEDDYQAGTGGSIYDGRKQVLYWADVSSEVAFVVPSTETFTRMAANTGEKSPHLGQSRTADLRLNMGDQSHPKPLTLSLEQGKPRTDKESPGSPHDAPRLRRLGRQPALTMGPDTKVFVVWLENFEDYENFPTGEMLPLTSTGLEQFTNLSSSSVKSSPEKDVFIIYIHALKNGLFRILMQDQPCRSMAIPLVDGMVVSRRTMGTMVRQTAINICRRKRLDSESYQPPHVRRKLKIKEIVEKYQLKMSEPDFYTSLFHDVPK
ncbi:hypothetical protein FSP39_023374 [Pinctada imbricata]|uniref:Rap-GAP domain-containing protein n=1 Tax=Pinctada imbricata TaxID=66713 RepID=A0AA88Y1C6_PINIB|nr:hypothetical protein FSP39_023374 [Pinctada imbricata]